MIKLAKIAISIIMFVLLIFLALSVFYSSKPTNTYSSSATSTVEEDLSIIDNGKHSAVQFISILNIIQIYYPESTKREIGDMIAYAYKTVKETLPDSTLYEVASDLKEMVVNAKAGTRVEIKLSQLVGTYTFLKTRGL